MTRMNPDPAAHGQLERLLDEELRAVVQASPVDLRARVLEAIGEVPSSEVRVPRTVESGFGRFLQPRWAFALGGAAVLAVAVVVVWRGSVRPGPEPMAVNRPALTSAPLSTGATIEPAAGAAPALAAATRTRRGPRIPAWGPEPLPVDASQASTEPYMPGAPAGELGDPLRPMPSPPPIAFDPIGPTPTVSEFARPVTDFPADDNPVPAVTSGTTGQSGGNRR
jgi:hypothetical protein